MLVLGIETSCDETAAAIVRDGKEILSNVRWNYGPPGEVGTVPLDKPSED